MPNVAPWFAGIVSVLTAPLSKTIRASEVLQLYEEKYGPERLCRIMPGVPDVREVEGKHGWRVGGVQVHSSGKRVVVVVGQLGGVVLSDRVCLIICSRGPRRSVCRCVTAFGRLRADPRRI